MRWLHRIGSAFTLPSGEPQETAKQKEKSDQRIVRAQSNGNIRLQHGRYSTRKQIDDQYDRVSRHRFGSS